MSVVLFFAPGIPQPKGSTRAFIRGGRAVTTHDNARTKPWQAVIAHAAQAAGATPLDGPLEIELKFYLPRPQGHFGKRGLRQSSPYWPGVKPDIDKLIRAALDALSGVAYGDDSRIVKVEAEKRYCTVGASAGVSVVIREARPTTVLSALAEAAA